jgi:hypothetical protein
VIECAKCGHRNADGTEFCQNCGTFLGYEGKKLEALPGTVLVTVTPTTITVAPGSQAAAEVRVRNKSNIVDQYEIQVTGEPAAWTVAEPSTLSLFPDKEGVATVRFRPPRSADVSAGRKPFAIKVQSKASPEISGRQEGVIEVAAIQEAGLSITPHTARAGESASYRLLLQNKGNAPIQVTLDASDPDELLTFEFDRPALTLGRGEAANVQLVVRPRATFYDGPPQPHAFKVQLSSDGVAPVSADATLLQEAIPRPVRKKFPLVPVLVGVLALGLLTGMVIERDPLMKLVGVKTSDSTVAPNTGGSPKASPTVSASVSPTATPVVIVPGQIPNVTCTSAIAAQQAIEQAGFKFVGSFVPNTNYPNGTVFKTSPPAGTAPLGSEVTAFVATGPAPSGRAVINPCRLILQTINPGILRQYAIPTPTP